MARIFISHSSDDSAKSGEARYERELRDALAKALAKERHEVLLDRTALEVGKSWREAINGWLGDCQAAIPLLSSKALEKSAWVEYEVSVLGFRRQYEGENFILVPVHLVPAKSLANWRRIDPSQILEDHAIQAYWKPKLEDASKRKQAIKRYCSDTLAKMKALIQEKGEIDLEKKTPLEAAITLVSEILDAVPSSAMLDRLSDELGLRLAGWEYKNDSSSRRLARALVTLGPIECTGALQQLSSDLRREHFEDIIHILSSSWVDGAAVQTLEEVIASSSDRAVGSTARKAETPQFYMWARRKKRPSQGWRVAAVNFLFGQSDPLDQESGLMEAVRMALVERLNSEREASQAALTWEEVKAKIRAQANRDTYRYFVALPRQGLDDRLVKRLREEFPEVGFFLLDCDEDGDASFFQQANVSYLRPALGKDDEDFYIETHKETLDALLN